MEVNTVWCLVYPYHIKICNSNIYVKNKLHGLVMGSEFKPATTMVSLLGVQLSKSGEEVPVTISDQLCCMSDHL